MKNKTIIWLIIGVFLVILGSGLFVGVMTVYNWNFENLSTTEYQTKTYEVNEEFKSIEINTNTADIVLIPSNEKTCKVICEEEVNSPHSVLTQSETLCIDNVEQKEWYEHIGINTKSPKITLYLPKTEYNSLIIKTDTGNTQLPENFEFKDISITTSTGDILAQNITCGNITANVSTGKTLLSDISCDYLLSSGDTGDIKLQKFIAKEKINIERSTGDINFNDCDSGELVIKTNTGDVNGSLLSDKIFETKSDTGDIKVPNTLSGGKCKITTDTGDINVDIIN